MQQPKPHGVAPDESERHLLKKKPLRATWTVSLKRRFSPNASSTNFSRRPAIRLVSLASKIRDVINVKALSLSKWENKNAKSTFETMIATAKIVIKAFPIAIKTARVEVRLVMMSSNAALLRHTEKKLRNAE
jgi:hypothetical protein